MNSISTILEEYDLTLNRHKAFEQKMCHLISELLDSRKIKVLNITSRTKDRESLKLKLESKDKYSNLSDITDIVGVRVITFFEDEVDTVANLVSEEFFIDKPNSVDRRIIEYDRFGYASLHYIVSLGKARSVLSEYKIFDGAKFEIQIRSILQHAWAEIEHDIGYKNQGNIPDIVKRNFSRIAALLETSDLEFTKLRDRLLQYKTEVKTEIQQHPVNVDLNDISLQSFAQTNKIIDVIDKELAQQNNSAIRNSGVLTTNEIPKLKYLGIENIQQLSDILEKKKDEILSFAKEFLKNESLLGFWNRGISLFYLSYLLIAEKNNKDFSTDIVRKFWPPENVDVLVNRIFDAYQRIKSK